MPTLVVQCPLKDETFRSGLEATFSDAVLIAEVKGFDGFECLQMIVSITLPLAPFVVDFLVGAIRESATRIIINPEGEIVLANYSSEEAKLLLQQLLDND